MKTVTFSLPEYVIFVPNGIVCLEVEGTITLVNETKKEFILEVNKCELSSKIEGFAVYLLDILHSDGRELVKNRLLSLFTEDITPELHQYFYSSNESPNSPA